VTDAGHGLGCLLGLVWAGLFVVVVHAVFGPVALAFVLGVFVGSIFLPLENKDKRSGRVGKEAGSDE
jgi:hypothetical protein